jgi:hypothetical protein
MLSEFAVGRFFDWEEMANELSQTELVNLSLMAAAQAVTLARIAVYLDTMIEENHEDAVIKQNQVAEKVNRALGYGKPANISF